jgi:hypothetical protein
VTQKAASQPGGHIPPIDAARMVNEISNVRRPRVLCEGKIRRLALADFAIERPDSRLVKILRAADASRFSENHCSGIQLGSFFHEELQKK